MLFDVFLEVRVLVLVVLCGRLVGVGGCLVVF